MSAASLTNTLKVSIGTVCRGRTTAGSTTLDKCVFPGLPGQTPNNLLLWSEDLTHVAWVFENGAAYTGPNSATFGTHGDFYQAVMTSLASGTTITLRALLSGTGTLKLGILCPFESVEIFTSGLFTLTATPTWYVWSAVTTHVHTGFLAAITRVGGTATAVTMGAAQAYLGTGTHPYVSTAEFPVLNAVPFSPADVGNVIAIVGGGAVDIWQTVQLSNLLTATAPMTKPPWADSLGSTTLTANYGTAPNGTQTSNRLQYSANDFIYETIGSAYVVGDTIQAAVWLKGTATQTVKIQLDNGSTPLATQTLTLTGVWQQVFLQAFWAAGIDNPTLLIGDIGGGHSARDIQIWRPWIGNGPLGAMFVTTIAGYVSSSQVTLAAAPTSSYYSTTVNQYTIAVYRPTQFRSGSLSATWQAGQSSTDNARFQVLQSYPYITQNQVIVSGQPFYLKSTDGAVGDLMGGKIDVLTVANEPGVNLAPFSWMCDCKSWDVLAERSVIQQALSFSAVDAGEAFRQTIMQSLPGVGISLDYSTGVNVTLDIAVGTFLSDALTQLATAAGGWYWRSGPWRVFEFKVQGAVAAPWNVDYTVGSNQDLLASITCQTSHDRFAPAALVSAKVFTDPLTFSFNGNGTTQIFSTAQPIYQQPQNVTLNGTPQTVGIFGLDTGKQWYWSLGSQAFTQDPGGTPIGGGDTLAGTYVSAAQAVGLTFQPGGIAEVSPVEGPGYLAAVSLAPPGVLSLLGANSFGANYTITYGSELPVKISAMTLKGGLMAGQVQSIKLAVIPANSNFFISQMRLSTQDNVVWWTYEAARGPIIGAAITALVNWTNQGASQPNVLPGK